MASVFFRGSKSAPRFYARFKGPDGRWLSRRVRQQTRRDALRVAAAMEAKAERQRHGLEAPDQVGVLCGPLMRKWGASLTNQSRDTDLGRIDKHVLPRWSSVRLADVTLASIMNWLDDDGGTRRRSGPAPRATASACCRGSCRGRRSAGSRHGTRAGTSRLVAGRGRSLRGPRRRRGSANRDGAADDERARGAVGLDVLLGKQVRPTARRNLRAAARGPGRDRRRRDPRGSLATTDR